MTSDACNSWVVYSPNESAISDDGAGFWSNESGWVDFDHATRFSAEEAQSLALPISVGGDARFVAWSEAKQHYA